MATNNLTVAGGSADLEISNGTDSYGYLAAKGSTISESRGSGFAGSVSSGAPTYQDAQPFQRTAWENFNGGFGQVLQNRVFGGSGTGGDSTRFFDGDSWTLKGNVLAPGMARNLIAPNYTAGMYGGIAAAPASPIADDWEIPHGVLPSSHPAGCKTTITLAGLITVQYIQVLVKFYNPSGSSITINATVGGAAFTSGAISSSTYGTYTNFKWVTLNQGGAGVNVGPGNVDIVLSANSNGVVYGCFAGTSGGTANVIQPYVQLLRNGTSLAYKDWLCNTFSKFEIVLDGGGNQNVIAIGNNAIFNASSNTTPPRGYQLAAAGTSVYYTGSIVFQNKVYVGSYDPAGPFYATEQWSNTDAIAVNARTNGTTVMSISSPVVHEGLIYYVDFNTGAIMKWDGTFPASPTTVINASKIGNPTGSPNSVNNPINNLFVFRGQLYVFKADGVFQVYDNLSDVTTSKVPRIIQIVNLSDQADYFTGKFVVEHQGAMFFNVRNLVYQLMPSGGQQPNQVTVLAAPFQMGRLTSQNMVSGIATDSQTLYVSYSNIGIVAYNGQGWHRVTDFYTPQTIAVGASGITLNSGLRYVSQNSTNPGGLYCGDGRQIVKVPIPAYNTSFSTQFYLADQNKCGYWISSVFDADLANIPKFLESIALRGAPSGFNYKIVAATWTSGSPNYRNIIEKTLNEGLHRDRWLSPQTPNASTNPPVVVTKLLDGSGNATATAAPCYYVDADFQNSKFTAEKFCSDDDVARPVSLVSCAFIVYFWNASGVQYDGNSAKSDISYLESIVLRFLATQRYVAIYQVRLDLQLLANEIGSQLTNSVYDATVAFLRTRALSLTPSTFTFYDMTVSSTQTSRTAKTVKGFIQNFRPEVDPNNSSPPGTLQGMVSFNILSLAEE